AAHARLRAGRSRRTQLARPGHDDARLEFRAGVKRRRDRALTITRERKPLWIGPWGGRELLRRLNQVQHACGEQLGHFGDVQRAALALPEAVRLDDDGVEFEKGLRPPGAFTAMQEEDDRVAAFG